MKKKVAVSLTSLSLAAAIAAGMGGQALAVEWHPSRTQSEVGVVERVAAGAASTIAVTQATGAAAAGQLADSTEQLLADTAPAAAAEFRTAVGEEPNQYTPVALYDVAASPSAEAAVAKSGSV